MTSIVQTRDLIKRNVDISKLPGHISASIRAFQTGNHAATQGDILTAYDALDYYLTWEGIIRYTDNLINLFIAVLDAVGADVAAPKTVFRTSAPILLMRDYFVTYAVGSKLNGCYSTVQAPDPVSARRTVDRITKGQFAFMHDEEGFRGQVERFGLKEVALQPQGIVG